MVESTQSNQVAIIEFLKEQQIAIPQSFIDRFVYQFERRDTFYSSLKAYDEWFKDYYPRYDNFVRAIKTELVETDDYIDAPQKGGGDKRDKRKEYLIQFEALQQLEMTQDKNTRIYYKTLQKLTNKFFDNQREKREQLLIQQLAQKDAQIKALQYPNPESIYMIYDKKTGRLLYVGSDLSVLQNRKYQHLRDRMTIVMAKYSLIDTYLATMDIQDIEIKSFPCEPGTAKSRETQMIQDQRPEFNIRDSVNNSYICLCNPQKAYKNRLSYEKHMQQFHQIESQQQQQTEQETEQDISELFVDN